MMFIVDFSECNSSKAFIPELFSLFQPVVTFEANLASISSIMVEFGTFDCVIVFPEYFIAKFPAKLQVIFFPFFWFLNVPHTKLSVRKLSTSTGIQRFPIGGQRFSTRGPLMTIYEILKSQLQSFLTGVFVLTIDDHRWVQ